MEEAGEKGNSYRSKALTKQWRMGSSLLLEVLALVRTQFIHFIRRKVRVVSTNVGRWADEVVGVRKVLF